MGLQELQPVLNHGVPVHGAHTAGEQDCAVPVASGQYSVSLPRRRNAVDKYDDRPTLFIDQLPCCLGQCLGQHLDGPFPLGVFDLLQDSGLVRRLAPAQRMPKIRTFVGLIHEYVRRPRGGCGRHDHGKEAPFKRRMRPGLETPNRSQGLKKWLRAVRLVEEDQAVVGDESRMDRPGAGGLVHKPRNSRREPIWSTVDATTVGCNGFRTQASDRYMPPRSR